MKEIKAEITFANKWVFGTIGDYKFEATVFDEPSRWGINQGRVSKLRIYVDTFQSSILNYDRGWDRKLKAEHTYIYQRVMELLENSPKALMTNEPNPERSVATGDAMKNKSLKQNKKHKT